MTVQCIWLRAACDQSYLYLLSHWFLNILKVILNIMLQFVSYDEIYVLQFLKNYITVIEKYY